jgi:two-component system, NtrC family, response regulator GlrR
MDSGRQARQCQALAKLVGQAPALLKMIEQMPAVAGSEAPVLVSGETGTGKELVARAVHYMSPRSESPFVAVNCGSLPETLVEDELFGHERGAFTNADARREGLIEQAEKGTLFLDEVDTLVSRAQVDLLRVLQDGKYRPIGSSREREANVRVVAATNVALDHLLPSGQFRKDLYYRLRVFSICLPPLRSRKEDIPLLAEHFLKKHAPANRSCLLFSSGAIGALLAYDWPGNIRELENAIIRGIHLCRHDLIEANDLGVVPGSDAPDAAASAGPGYLLSFRAMKQTTIQVFERNYLARLMLEHRGNVSQAARASGKERRDLGKLLRKYQLDPKSF